MFCSQDIQIFAFLMNPQTSKSVSHNEIWLDVSETYDKHFYLFFISIIKTGN